MKITVILAVLFASLLVVAGTAFALSCCNDTCYKVTLTDLTDPHSIPLLHWSVCFDGDNLAEVCDLEGPTFLFVASFFRQSLIDQAVSINPASTGAYMRFHGSEDDIFNGLFYSSGDQYEMHGVEEPCPD